MEAFQFKTSRDEKPAVEESSASIANKRKNTKYGSKESPSPSNPLTIQRQDEDGTENDDSFYGNADNNNNLSLVQQRAALAAALPTRGSGTNTSPPVSLDQERQLAILMLLAQVCALHDSTPKTLVIYLLDFYESGVLDYENIKFLFDFGLLPTPTPANYTNNNESSENGAEDYTLDIMSVTGDGATYDIDSSNGHSNGNVDVEEQNVDNLSRDETGAIIPYQNSPSTSPTHLAPPVHNNVSNNNNNNNNNFTEAQRRSELVSKLREHLARQDSATCSISKHDDPNSTTSADNSKNIIHNPHPPYQRQSSSSSTTSSWALEDHPLHVSRYNREFVQKRLLASGSFGHVYRATYKLDNCDYAVKRVIFSAKGYDTKQVEMVIREVQCLAKLGHENVVRYYTSWLEPSWHTGSVSFDPKMNVDGDAEDKREEEGGVTVTCPDEVVTKEDQKMLLSCIQRHRLRGDTNTLFQTIGAPLMKDKLDENQQCGDHQHLSGWSFQSEKNAVNDWNQLASYKDLSLNTISTGGYGNDSEYSDWTVDQSSKGYSYDISRENAAKQPGPQWGPRQKRQQHEKVYQYQICLFIQMELCQSSTLADWIRHRNNTNPFQTKEKRQEAYKLAWDIFLQLVRGLEHVHSKGIIHRDMKPANVFASKDGQFKIGDFGLSKMLKCANKDNASDNVHQQPEKEISSTAIMFPVQHNNLFPREWQDPVTTGVGTASYASPEQITSKSYGPEADIFSLGLILLELFSDFGSEHERAMTFQNCRRGILPKWSTDTHPGETITNIISSCTSPLASRRPTASQIRIKIQEAGDIELQQIIAEQKRQLHEKDALIEKQMKDLMKMKGELESQRNTSSTGKCDTKEEIDVLGIIQTASSCSDDSTSDGDM